MFVLKQGQHRFTEIKVLDKPGDGGAYHQYRVVQANEHPDWPQAIFAEIKFQKGPVKEEGKNGIFIEDLLHICQHRLQCFQGGDFACEENARALAGIEEALYWLNKRTVGRQTRGVEGTTQN